MPHQTLCTARIPVPSRVSELGEVFVNRFARIDLWLKEFSSLTLWT